MTTQTNEPSIEQTPALDSNATPTTVQETDFGRIDHDGNVFVKDGGEERLIGSYPAGVPDDPFAMYERRFEDLKATIKLFEDRLQSLAPRDIDQSLATLVREVQAPAAIGDLVSLRQRVEELSKRAEERKEQAREERRVAREEALRLRTEVVESVETLAAQDPSHTHWKQSGQTIRDLLDQWKTLQRRGPRLDKATEDDLWKRFSAARAQLDRHRRQFFAALDQEQTEGKRQKEQLIQEAVELQHSTDWGSTSAAYRKLMDRWKVAPRASRKEDDALWARFRAAQQVFFDARRAKDQAMDTEYQENLEAKEALLIQAEAIVPITDLETAKRQLRDIQDQWDAIGHVPSSEVNRIEKRMRSVEDAVRSAEDREWRRSNPETRARAAGMLGQLEAQIDELKADLEAAQLTGDQRRVKELEDTLNTKQAWLDQISHSME